MNRSWILLVAGRYFKTRRKERGHIASLLSVAGIAVGVMTLVAVLAVMNGFQISTIDAILELNSYHLRVGSREALPDERIRAIRNLPGFEAVFPFAEVQTLIRGQYPDPQVCVLRALPENITSLDPQLENHLTMVQGTFNLSGAKTLIIGSELARFLGVNAGDRVSLLNLSGGDFADLKPENLLYRVAGIFKSGYYEYDLGWGFISLDNAEDFLPPKAENYLAVKLKDRFRDREAERAATAALSPFEGRVVSWREYNRAIFGALRVEKVLMMVIIGLIFVVVAGNIYQSLRRSVYERTEEIGVLKALGAGPDSIRLIFVLEGAFIGTAGAGIGLFLGFLVSGRINEIFALAEGAANFFIGLVNAAVKPYFPGSGGREISLFSPAYFYLSEVPSRVHFEEALMIYFYAVLSAILAAYFASRRISTIKPAEVLRYE
jgi:lipoprotein-releasing system permease protein